MTEATYPAQDSGRRCLGRQQKSRMVNYPLDEKPVLPEIDDIYLSFKNEQHRVYIYM